MCVLGEVGGTLRVACVEGAPLEGRNFEMLLVRTSVVGC